MKKLMLSANEQPKLHEINYPVLVSGKLDGVRGCVQEDQLVSRSLKSSMNRHVTNILSSPLFEGLDGELCVPGKNQHDFNLNQSTFMTQTGNPAFVWHVFDDMSDPSLCAADRKDQALTRVISLTKLGYDVKFCAQHWVVCEQELLNLYDAYRLDGYEGLIIMDPTCTYKHGRSTLNQGISLKMKPCEDDEAVITGFEPVQHNTDAGNSNKAENMYDGDRAGKVLAKWRGLDIKMGGMKHDLARDMLRNPDAYIGKLVKFKYMELTPYGMPRCPVFKGIRDPEDLS